MIKPENNWRQKTLENLEKDFWGPPTHDSYLVRRTHEIRKIPLTELNNEDIAMMVRQKFSLDYIVPLAIDKLKADILAHGNTGSDGEIMDAILKIPKDFWITNKDHWTTIKKLLDENESTWTFRKRDNFDNAISN